MAHTGKDDTMTETVLPKPPMTRDGVDGAYELVDGVGQAVRVGDEITTMVTGNTFTLLDGTPPTLKGATGNITVSVPEGNAPQGIVSPMPFGLRWVKIIPRD